MGLGNYLTDEVQKIVNSNRKGTSYLSKDDAQLVHGADIKSDINDDPMLRYFSAGANKEGYWTSSHAKLQLEDYVDFLSVIFPKYNCLFLMINYQDTLKCTRMAC